MENVQNGQICYIVNSKGFDMLLAEKSFTQVRNVAQYPCFDGQNFATSVQVQEPFSQKFPGYIHITEMFLDPHIM